MPIYEYECVSNKHRFEIIQKFDDPPVSHCTICGGPVQRLLSAPAIQFKGSGWYITDYARKGESGSKSASSKSDEKESKPATEEKGTKEADSSAPAKSSSADAPTSSSSDAKKTS